MRRNGVFSSRLLREMTPLQQRNCYGASEEVSMKTERETIQHNL